jgi:DNA-binding NtrC family response regulator
MLEDAGSNIHSINVASDFDEASRLFFQEDHQVVLLDINLPGKNGIEFLKLVKGKKQETEVIMITNHADAYYKRQCLELGASHFLDKSEEFMKLPSLISKTVSEQRTA